MNEQTRPVDQEIIDIFSLFLDETPVSAELIDTSRGEEDFRNTYIIGTAGPKTGRPWKDCTGSSRPPFSRRT